MRNKAVTEAFSQESFVPNPQEVKKPWGRFIQYTLNQPTTVKILEVNPGEILSLQSHHHRDELWVPLTSGAVVEIDGHVLTPEELEPVFIPRYTKHRLSAKDQKVRVLEISFGTFDEEDVIRHEDKYGRNTQNRQERGVEE